MSRATKHGVAVVAAVAVAAGVALARTAGHPAAAQPVVEIHAAHGASFVPALEGSRPLFVLVLGSDARPGHSIERQNADSIHVIGVDPRTHHATVLGFPRDSWVPIPGHGTNKINQATKIGGPDLLVKTIEALTGIPIDFWVLTTFPGFVGMVDGVGGLTVDVPTAMHDSFSGANFSPGVHHLSGAQALAFSRDRHDFLNGDLTRVGNQGRLILAALAALERQFGNDPASLLRWIATGWSRIRTDLDVPTLLGLGLAATQVDEGSVNNVTVPATTGVVNGIESVVFISPSASSIYADMRPDGVVGGS